MSRRGRKRKPGLREPSGRLQRPTQAVLNELNAQEQRRVKTIVLMQPHRREAKEPESPHLECALGRFFLKTGNRAALDAGEKYAGLVRRWRAAWGAASVSGEGEGLPTGDGPSAATVAAWRRDIDKVEAALDRLGCVIRFAVTRLAIDDRDPVDRRQELDALCGLHAVAVELGVIGPAHPFK